MPYFNYHVRNKKLIKEGLLKEYYYEDYLNKRVMILVFKDGRQFPVKEERWMDYYKVINDNYGGEGK